MCSVAAPELSLPLQEQDLFSLFKQAAEFTQHKLISCCTSALAVCKLCYLCLILLSKHTDLTHCTPNASEKPHWCGAREARCLRGSKSSHCLLHEKDVLVREIKSVTATKQRKAFALWQYSEEITSDAANYQTKAFLKSLTQANQVFSEEQTPRAEILGEISHC